MKRAFALALALLAGRASATTLTGTILSPGGTPVTGTLYLQLSQSANLNAGLCGGPKVIANLPPFIFNLTNGQISGPVSLASTVPGADCLTPAGLTYHMTVTGPSGGTVLERDVSISGTSVDLGTLSPVTPSGTPTTPQLAGDVTGPATANSVTRLQGKTLSLGTPTNGQYIGWTSATSRYENKTLPAALVSSVSGSGGTTGLTLTGGPTGAVTLTLGGTLVAGSGGTGVSVAEANKLFSGPALGADAAPTFRSMVIADLPDLSNHVVLLQPGPAHTQQTGIADVGTIYFNTLTGTSLMAPSQLLISPVAGGAAAFRALNLLDLPASLPAATLTTTDDNATNATMYPLFQSAVGGTNPVKTSSLGLTYNPSTGRLGANVMSAISGIFTNVSATTFVRGPIQDKGGQVFNILAYGALCDGTADDAAAIQTAVTAAAVAGGSVFTPQGSSPCNIGSSITVSSSYGVRIVGATHGYPGPFYVNGSYKGATWRWVGAANGKMIQVTTGGGTSGASNSVEHMNLDGGGIAGVQGIFADGGDPGVTVQKQFLVQDIICVRLNQCIHAGNTAGHPGYGDQVDSTIIRRIFATEPDNTTTSAAVYLDSRNISNFWMTDSGILGHRYGVYIANIGYAKIGPGVTGGMPDDGTNTGGVQDLIYLNGNHGALDLEQVQAESSNSTFTIASNPQALGVPINLRSATLDSNQFGNKSTVVVGAQSLLNSFGNQYDRPITFTAGASVFNSYGDAFVNVGGASPGSIVVGATGTVVNRTDGATGNLGIGLGDTAPSRKFHVFGTPATTGIAVSTTDWVSGATGSILDLGQGATTGNTYSTISALSNGGGAWNNLVLQMSGGKVGIGTTTPATFMQILGANSPAGIVSPTSSLLLTDSSALGANTGGHLTFGGHYTAGAYTEFAAIGAVKDNATSGEYGAGLALYTRANGSGPWGAKTDARMFLDSAGNVGIGTTAPAQKLDISSTAPSFQMTDTTASAKSLRVVTDANVANFYEAAGAAGDILSLDLTNKRVGIGTSSPAGALDLALGGIAFRPADVTVSNGANNNLVVGPGVFFVIVGPTAVANITGIAGGYNGRLITLTNSTGFNVTFNYNNGGSAAANRFLFNAGADVVLGAYQSIVLINNNGIWYCLTK